MYIKPRFRKLSDKEYNSFWESLRDARSINEHGNFVLLRDVELYKDSQNFLLGNGVAGYAIYEGELISVHKNNKKAQDIGIKHVLPKIVRSAIKHDARYIDCYGEFLANYYMSNGFVAVAKVKFDALDDNPVTWEYDKFGKPDIYMLVRAVDSVEDLEQLSAKKEIITFDEIKDYVKYFEDIDECLKYRNEMFDKFRNLDYKSRVEFVKKCK